MKSDFPFVKIPDRYREIIGEPDPNTRMYRAYGDEDDYVQWFDTICKICDEDNAVSPGGVSAYAKVSRAGVHKRLKSGNLTIFLFHLVKDKSFLFKKGKKLHEGGRPYGYVPVSECKAWARELNEIRDAKKISEEVNGENDFEGKFLTSPKDWKKKIKTK